MSAVDKLIAEDRRKPRRILIIGDGMQDVYVHGHLSTCQEGCPKFVEESYVEVPGGAANAARSLMHWRARKVCMFSSRGAAVKTRFMVGDECVFRYDDEPPGIDYSVVRDEALTCLREWKPDGVLLSDYNKGVLIPEFSRKVIAECRRAKVPCVVDPKQEPGIYAGAVIKSNKEWLRKYIEHEIPTPHVITNGPGDIFIRYADSTDWIRELDPVLCVNHVGAGDCFAAHLTLALACGLSLKEAAGVAYSAGRVYVQRPHNSPPHPDEVSRDSMSTTTE